MNRRPAFVTAMTVLALLSPITACKKGPRSVLDIAADGASGPKPSYPDLVRVDPQIAEIIDQAKDGGSATESVLEHVNGRLAQAADPAIQAYAKLLLVRIANAKAHHPEDCPGVLRGDQVAIARDADAKAEHAWVVETLHPTRQILTINTVVIGASAPASLNIQPKPGESACDASRDMLQAILDLPAPTLVAGLRTLGVTVGTNAL